MYICTYNFAILLAALPKCFHFLLLYTSTTLYFVVTLQAACCNRAKVAIFLINLDAQQSNKKKRWNPITGRPILYRIDTCICIIYFHL